MGRPRGRPTDDPKTELVAVRLAPRHVEHLDQLAERGAVSFSEALRQLLDDVLERARRKRTSKATAKGSKRKRATKTTRKRVLSPE
jgi:Arc/MetJ-type ribon-helix-helix transcriptional regulator